MTLESLEGNIYDNSLAQWLLAVAVLVLTVIILWIVQRIAAGRLKAFSARTVTQWDDIAAGMVHQTRLAFLLVVGIYAGSLFLELPDTAWAFLSSVLVITILVQSGL